MKSNFFQNAGSPVQVPTVTSQLLEQLQVVANQGSGQFVTPDVAKAAMAMESMNQDKQFQLNTAVESLSNMLSGCVKSLKDFGNLSIAQEQAGITAAVLSANPQQYLLKPMQSAAVLQAAANSNTFVIGHDGMSNALESRGVSMEAFDTKVNNNAMQYSVTYNMQAARQDEFGEAFFPTVVVTPDNVGFMVSIRLIYVQEDARHELTGALAKFGRKNIIKAVIDPTILRNDQTRIVPVVRTGGGNDSTAMFVAAGTVAPYTVINDNASVTTAPLAIGKKLNLLGISQTAAMIAANTLDITDAIDSSVRLANVYVRIATGTPCTVKFAVDKLPGSDFNAATQGNSRLLQLRFETDALKVVLGTKAVDGATVTQFAALTDRTVRLSAQVFGSVLQDKGDTSVNASDLTVAKITTTDGQLLDLSTGTGATLAAIFAGATIVGYDLIAYRTNSNRRQRGQLIDTQYVNHLYTVPLLAPITALRPIGDTEANDSALLSALITTTHIRTSNAAVTALLDHQAFLKDYVSAADLTNDAPAILGVARELVSATYLEDSLDVKTHIDSLKSSDRTDDLAAVIINKIRDMAYRMYTSSGFKAASNALYDGAAPKPLLIIGTDQILERYLTLNGDMRLLGEFMDYKLVSSLDNRMVGKMIFAFGVESAYNSGVPTPLHFGAMAWKPELTLMMPITRNGATTMELTVSPSFRHTVNVPVMGSLTVTNIDQVIASKVAVNTSVV